MKKVYLNIVSIAMISVILFVVMGLQLHYHTCGETGIRNFQIIETPECACEVGHIENNSCCTEDSQSYSTCHSKNADDKSGNLSFKQLDCCQDEIFNISLESYFILTFTNYLQTYKCYVNIVDYNSIKIRFEEFKYKLSQSKTLMKIPRDIIFNIIRVIHFSDSNKSDHISH